MRFLCSILALASLVGTTARAAGGAAGEPPRAGAALVSATRQTAFTIPFRIEPPESPTAQPVEVQLHVSSNSGASWEVAARVKPDKAAFVFRAPRDGEYWYSIRTVDGQGVTRPDGPLQPQLKVTVDTIAPRLDLTASRGPAGEIVARWQAVDPHLKLNSFKLEYQARPSDPWERVAVDAPSAAMKHTLSGETTWWPRASGGPLLVRAEITDEAGNPAVCQAVVKESAAPPTASGPANPGDRVSNGALGNNTRWNADRSTNDTLSRAQAPTQPDPTPNWRMASSGSSLIGDQSGAIDSLSRGGPPGSPLDFSRLPMGARPRMVNARAFELEYEIDSIGTSGISKIELWGTRDGGQTWSVFGIDSDNRSPVVVNLDAEGIYGFRVVAQSGSGLSGRTPAAGDLPDIWIGIDLTKPVVKLARAEMAPDAGELVIEWEATDDVLDTRPISLSFSTAAQGPWTPIAAGLENTGSYRWRLDSRVPDRIYLRLDARDEAGNVGSFETAEPVALDRQRPEGRIRGIRAVGPGAAN